MEEEDRPNGPEPSGFVYGEARAFFQSKDEADWHDLGSIEPGAVVPITDNRWTEFVQSFLEEALEKKATRPFSCVWGESTESDPAQDIKDWQRQAFRLSGYPLWNLSFELIAPFPFIEALYYGTHEVPLDPGRIQAARYLACGSRVRNVLGRRLLSGPRR